jgi:hypothetical protein
MLGLQGALIAELVEVGGVELLYQESSAGKSPIALRKEWETYTRRRKNGSKLEDKERTDGSTCRGREDTILMIRLGEVKIDRIVVEF